MLNGRHFTHLPCFVTPVKFVFCAVARRSFVTQQYYSSSGVAYHDEFTMAVCQKTEPGQERVGQLGAVDVGTSLILCL